MKAYQEMNRGELTAERAALQQEFDGYKAKGLKLNMARGKPGADQLALSMPMLDVLNSGSDCKDEGIDCRNYGELTGIPSAKKLFGEVMGVSADEIIIGGSSSLTMMYDCMSRAMLKGEYGKLPGEVSEELRSKAGIAPEDVITCRPADLLEPELEKYREEF